MGSCSPCKTSFCNQFTALFKKNITLWYRNLCGSLCEILFPFVLMFIIVIVRFLVANKDYAEESYITNSDFSFFYDETTKTFPESYPKKVLDPATYRLSLPPGNPFTECMKYNRYSIAFVGDDDLRLKVEKFLFSPTGGNHLRSKYVVFENITRLNGGQKFKPIYFANEGDMENYAEDKDYDTDSMPGICAGIVITSSGNKIDVKLRYDDNNYQGTTNDGKQEIPTTRTPIVNNLIR